MRRKISPTKVILFLATIVFSSLLLILFDIEFESIFKAQISELITDPKEIPATHNLTSNDHTHQRMVILAGPHKTGSSSIQTNMIQLTRNLHQFNNPTINDWVWPAPPELTHFFTSQLSSWNPAKVFYPMMQAFFDQKRKPTIIFQHYTKQQVLEMYRNELHTVWERGFNIVFGSESIDFIMKVNDKEQMLNNFVNHIIPPTIDQSQITVIIAYRTPKIDHLISMWLQSWPNEGEMTFQEWILKFCNQKSTVSLGALDALGMVDLFLQHTQYNVELIDLSGVTEAGWDVSNVIACDIMNVPCEDKHVEGVEVDPIIKNVKRGTRKPDVDDEKLREIDELLRKYDCNYLHLFTKKVDRLHVSHPLELTEIMKSCEDYIKENSGFKTKEIKQLISKIISTEAIDDKNIIDESTHIHAPDSETTNIIPVNNTAEKLKQRIIFIAGPHKTGSTSLQTNMWRWTNDNDKNKSNNTSSTQTYAPILPNWKWPAPEEICQLKYDRANYNWNPSKAFYPMIEALNTGKVHDEEVFDVYTNDQVLDFYGNEMRSIWDQGYNIIFGSESMDIITKPHHNVTEILGILKEKILPLDMEDEQVTVVISYRTPKIRHFISMWLQNHPSHGEKEFMEFFFTKYYKSNKMGSLDALGMVDLFLQHTQYNVELIDLSGVTEAGWDVSNVVACDIMNVPCEDKHVAGIDVEPLMANIKEDSRRHYLDEPTLDEIDTVLRRYDCNYIHLFNGNLERLHVVHSLSLTRLMEECEGLPISIPSARKAKNSISNILRKKQKMVILAGPHKTGSSSIQTNMLLWTRNLYGLSNYTSLPSSQYPAPINNWVWAAPPNITDFFTTKFPKWNPSKVFYPLIEALHDGEVSSPSKLFDEYSKSDVLDLYRNELHTVWERGVNIVFGSEAFDFIVKVNDREQLLNNFVNHIIPSTIDQSQITVIIAYRTPKIDHLISMWLQNCPNEYDKTFHEWILEYVGESTMSLGALDALGMADSFLQHTQYNVELLDLSGVTEAGWDVSNVVACDIMNVPCEDKHVEGVEVDPIIKNVKHDTRKPDVDDEKLREIDELLRKYDCNYLHLFTKKVDRLHVSHPLELTEIMKSCEESEGEHNGIKTEEVKERISKIIEKDSRSSQRILILAGPHKTGSTSLETNMWTWTNSTDTTMNSSLLPNWKWPAPEPICELKRTHFPKWWNPSKAFYPMIEAMSKDINKHEDQEVFEIYSKSEVMGMYGREIRAAWDQGYHVVFGTEGFDRMLKGETNAVWVLKLLKNRILPFNINPSQVSVVIAYRTPKINHLISMWLQNCPHENDMPFSDFLIKFCSLGYDSMGTLDALAMVYYFLNYTEYNVELIDLMGVTESGWDVSSLVACDIMNVPCEDKHVLGLDVDPIIKNVKHDTRQPDIDDEKLQDINDLLMHYDCKYMWLIEGKFDRLRIVHPLAITSQMEFCTGTKKFFKNGIPILTPSDVKDEILEILGQSIME